VQVPVLQTRKPFFMCGIAGFLSPNLKNSNTIAGKMIAALRHRGPDASNIYCSDSVSLAHARLSIIDVEGGGQPITNEDKTVWLTFNGEIYNYREIRKSLLESGHHFRTSSDSEVIVHAYEEWGTECFSRFRGMFALGIWDAKKRQIVVARDRIGIKPLVYIENEFGFAFASEISALTHWPGFKPNVNFEALDMYLFLQYVPAPYSAYQCIKKLPPATYMVVDYSGKSSEPRPYWSVQFQPDETKSLVDWTEQLDDVIRESVVVHTVSDVGCGAFLSGGLDSSTVVSCMPQSLNGPVQTFCIRFDEQDFDESPYARYVAKKYDTLHYEETVGLDALDILPSLARHYGEPFADSSAVPTYFLSQLASRHVKVVLSGDGGDEIFAGYESYTAAIRSVLGPRQPLASMKFAVGNHLRALGLLPKLRNRVEIWADCVKYFSLEERLSLWLESAEVLTASTSSWFGSQFKSCEHRDLCSQLQHMDLISYLPNDILTKVDIASMCHGLEVRVPLLDHKVIDFAATIPARLKWKEGNYVRGDKGKYLLRKLLEDRFSKDFIHRPKKGFEVPIRKWFQSGYEEQIRERLLDAGNPLLAIFSKSRIETLLERQTLSGDQHGKVWALLFLSEWMREMPFSLN